MTVSLFIPSHITGFFSIENNPDPLKNGSCGAGFLLDRGVKTTIKNSSEFKIDVNQGSDIVINEVLKYFDVDKSFKIIQDIQFPIGGGFGTSAASALSLSLALNEFFDYGYSQIECGQIAHKVDVALSGGLGVATKFLGKIDTASVIHDSEYKKTISDNGHECLEKFKKNSNVENFLRLSLEFSQNTKLMTDEVQSLVNYFNSLDDILGSSMAMLGNTVFAFADNETTFKDLKIENLNIDKLYLREQL